MYQIHMPWPANAVPLAVVAVLVGGTAGAGGAGGCSLQVTTLIGPYVFECRPPDSRTSMYPECALAGTVTTRPSFDMCRCALGELPAMRACHDRGNATDSPLFRPLPCISRLPCVETSCVWCRSSSPVRSARPRSSRRRGPRLRRRGFRARVARLGFAGLRRLTCRSPCRPSARCRHLAAFPVDGGATRAAACSSAAPCRRRPSRTRARCPASVRTRARASTTQQGECRCRGRESGSRVDTKAFHSERAGRRARP